MQQLTVLGEGEWGHTWPQILPGNQWILFTRYCNGVENQFELCSLQTGMRRVLMKGGTCARYVPTGHIVYVDNKTLYAVPFDLEQLKVIRSAVPVAQDIMTPGSGSAQCAISNDGSFAFIPAVTHSAELRPVWVDRQGQFEVLPMAMPRNYGDARISPNENWIAFTIQDGLNSDIWIYDLTRHTLNPLTSGGYSGLPIWSPDGESLLFGSYQARRPQLFKQRVSSSGEPVLCATLEDPPGAPIACSPDGSKVLVSWSDPEHPMWDDDIYVLFLDEQNQKIQSQPFIQRNHNQRHGIWSPDGRWIAYASDETGRWEVYVEPYPGPGPKTMVSTEGGFQPVWAQDGKELFFRSKDKMMSAAVEMEPAFRVIKCEVLFEGTYLSRVNRRDFDVASDGRFLMIREPEESAPLGIHITLNWFEELKRLAPPDEGG